MKLVSLSDIHGSAKWCAEALRVVDELSPDKLVLLGDVLYHGPRNPLPDEYAPAEVAAMLNPLADRIVAVRGNCDSEVDQMMLDFPCMADYAWILDGTQQIYCTHGHLWDHGNLPQLPAGSVFAYGHFHVKRNEDAGSLRLFNPGSVGLPKDGTHSVGIYDGNAFSFRELQ